MREDSLCFASLIGAEKAPKHFLFCGLIVNELHQDFNIEVPDEISYFNHFTLSSQREKSKQNGHFLHYLVDKILW